MNQQIQHVIHLLKETYEGDPWHGRSVKALLREVSPEVGLKQPNPGSHSIAELIYHIVTWRDFTISRLKPEAGKDTHYFEKNDWRALDLNSFQTWELGLQLLDESQERLLNALEQLNDSVLTEQVAERNYDFNVLLYGLVQHEAYHAGQIAYAMKLLSSAHNSTR